jgi:hypothetical protein
MALSAGAGGNRRSGLKAESWKLEAGSWKLEARAVGATAGYVEALFVGWVELAIPMLPG